MKNHCLYRFYVPAIALIGFLWLAYYSLNYPKNGYSSAETSEMDALIDKSLKAFKNAPNAETGR